MVSLFNTSIITSLDKFAPLRPIVITTRRKPWVTPDIRAAIKDRNKIYKTACDSGSSDLLIEYRARRAAILRDLRAAKNNHYANEIETAQRGNNLWSTLRKLGVVSSRTTSPSSRFSLNAINTHFASISNLPPPHLHFPVSVHPPSLSLSQPFSFKPISVSNVSEALAKAKSKTLGLDGISIKHLTLLRPYILQPITRIFNDSINTSTFPTLWKRTLITPIPKASPLNNVSDLRPISRLSECSKLLERILANQLLNYLEEHDLLTPRQAGFRTGHSTQTALLGVLDDIRLAMDDSKYTILVLFDFSKAFDRIPHQLLIHKLRSFKIADHTLQWFISYLADRCQAVADEGGSISDWLSTSAGVPQGSVLGPLLFAIFINDLPKVLRFSGHMIYADDTQIYHSCKRHELPEAINRISQDCTAIANWAAANGLTLNLNKTKAMVIGSSLNLSLINLHDLPSISVNQISIPYVSEVKNLGVWFSSDLNWGRHVSHICQQVFRTLRQLRPHQRAFSFGLRKSLVQSLILPFFDYACLVYHDLSGELNLKLQRAQNACTRFVFGNIPWMDHVTPYRQKLGWLTVKARREYFLGALTYTLLKTGRPNYLANNFILTADQGVRRSTRHRVPTFYIRRFNTNLFFNSFQISASYFWNNLPDSITSLPHDTTSLKTVKSSLLKHLYSCDVAMSPAYSVTDTRPPA